MLVASPLVGQITLTQQQVVDSAVMHSPMVSAAEYKLLSQHQLKKSAFNLPNPEVVAESPTGEFYTIGVLQTFEFPSVYFKQRKVASQQEELAITEKSITVNEARYQASVLYVQFQYLIAQLEQLRVRDSLYEQLSSAANRMFAAGQMDFLEKTYAESQYGEVHLLFTGVKTDVDVIQQQLRILTGISTSFVPTPITKLSEVPGIIAMTSDSGLFIRNPLVDYYRRQNLLSTSMLSLEKQRALPGFVLGYFNQGPMTTPIQYRFRAGITVPLWFWQYSGNIRAARYQTLRSAQLYKANQQQMSAQQVRAQGDYFKYKESVAFYESKGMKQSLELINASERFYSSGQYDLVTHIRNLNDAFEIQLNYLEALKNYNLSVVQIHNIQGTL